MKGAFVQANNKAFYYLAGNKLQIIGKWLLKDHGNRLW
jgi:hypothetical protein